LSGSNHQRRAAVVPGNPWKGRAVREAIWQVFLLLFRLFIAYAFFAGARRASSECHRSKLQVCLCAIALSGALAFFSWTNYGTHVEDADPVFGGGTEVVDFEPTGAERNRHAVEIFAIASALTLTGSFVGLRERDKRLAGDPSAQ
jgi:hypothetical protein